MYPHDHHGRHSGSPPLHAYVREGVCWIPWVRQSELLSSSLAMNWWIYENGHTSCSSSCTFADSCICFWATSELKIFSIFSIYSSTPQSIATDSSDTRFPSLELTYIQQKLPGVHQHRCNGIIHLLFIQFAVVSDSYILKGIPASYLRIIQTHFGCAREYVLLRALLLFYGIRGIVLSFHSIPSAD